MNPITTFNAWILGKIISYLSNKEGCETETAVYTMDGMKAIVKDAFGYRYEIHVKTLSRVTNDPGDFDENDNFTKNIGLVSNETRNQAHKKQ